MGGVVRKEKAESLVGCRIVRQMRRIDLEKDRFRKRFIIIKKKTFSRAPDFLPGGGLGRWMKVG